MTEYRNNEEIKNHYEIEKELANKLRKSTFSERKSLYAEVYDEWHARLPNNPLMFKKGGNEGKLDIKRNFIKRFINKNSIFTDIGAGDCNLAIKLAADVSKVFAVDVSDKIFDQSKLPKNFSFSKTDGLSFPFNKLSIDVAYSDQVMEHIHPDDASMQVKGIYDSLKFGGVYICCTPNRLVGPFDISKYFDKVATGFHLKEYTNAELGRLMKDCGFSKVRAYVGGKGRYIGVPMRLIQLIEKCIELIPYAVRKKLFKNRLGFAVLGIRLVAYK